MGSDSTPSASPAGVIRSRSWASYSPSLPHALGSASDRYVSASVLLDGWDVNKRSSSLLATGEEVQRKIVILGFRAVGKTALATRYCEGKHWE